MYECATCLRMPEIYVTGLEAVTGTLVVYASYVATPLPLYLYFVSVKISRNLKLIFKKVIKNC